VHRDVKAENVLFNNADRPQLTDFGIALSRRTGRARITTDGLALGSGGYMSPEQARGEPVDGRADLYSLGVLTYEMLTGELPFEAEDSLALALMHAQDPIPRLPPDKAHWQRFIDTAVAKSPDKRFRNAQAMARALDPLARRLAPPSGMRAFIAHAFWRTPLGLVTAGALLAVALLIVVTVYLPDWRERMAAGDAPEAGADTVPLVIPPEAVAPTPEEIRAGLALRVQQARALLERGQLIAPAGENAAEAFLAILRDDPANADAAAGVEQVVTALGRETIAAVQARQRDQVRAHFEEARLLVEGAQLQATPAWEQLRRETADAIARVVEAALLAHDRETSLSWASLPLELGIDDERSRLLRARVAQLPNPGSTIRDENGPELSYVPANLGGSRLDHGFALMRNEVTRGEYASFVAQTRRAPARCRNRLSPLQLLDRRQWNDAGFTQAGNHPVVCVGYEDARAYAAWLSTRTGQRYRLPTLKEWLHARGAGNDGPPCRRGNVADRTAGVRSAFTCSDGQRWTAPVRAYLGSSLQLFDLHGNVSEWTLACGESGNPLARLLEDERCARRAVAGTSWRSGSDDRVSVQMLEPDRGYDDVGFRLVREL
jgi:serine/threonine-protein kinase PpkA